MDEVERLLTEIRELLHQILDHQKVQTEQGAEQIGFLGAMLRRVKGLR